jgi:hypothetical protein
MAFAHGLSPSRREIHLLLAVGHTWISLQTWFRFQHRESSANNTTEPSTSLRLYRLLRLLNRLDLVCSVLLVIRAAWRMFSS